MLFTRVTEAFDSLLEFCNKLVEETKNALLDGNAEVDVDEPGSKVFEEGSEVADFPICGEKVVRRFRVVMDSIDSFADSITVIDIFCVGDDLIIFDVEFPKTPLALFDVTMLVNFKLVTTGEAVKDEWRTSVDETFGCKAELVKFLLTVDMLVITELDQSKAGLDERNKGLDNISVELLNGQVARELVLVTRVGIVGTIMLVTIGTVVGWISVVAVLSRTLVLFIASIPEDRFFTTVDSNRELEIGDNEARLLTIFFELV